MLIKFLPQKNKAFAWTGKAKPEIKKNEPRTIAAIEFEPENLEQRVKKLLDDINIGQFTGEKIAGQISTVIDHGFSLKKQLGNSLEHTLAQYLEGELQGFTTRTEFNDFINGLDELSFHIERLKAHANQLTSCHEIN